MRYDCNVLNRTGKSVAYKILPGLALVIVLQACASAAQQVPAADQIVAQAKAAASRQKKDVFLMFGASWCGPCKELEAFRAAPEIRPILEKYFVFAELNIYEERGKKPELNTPGGEALAVKFGGGEKSGVPFIVFLGARGEPIVTSNRQINGKAGENVGYPVLPEEIDWFMAMLRKGVPSLSKVEAQTIETWLKKRAKSLQ